MIWNIKYNKIWRDVRMLYITFKESSELIRDVDNYFNHWHDTEWFNDSIVQQIVLDIDKTKIE